MLRLVKEGFMENEEVDLGYDISIGGISRLDTLQIESCDNGIVRLRIVDGDDDWQEIYLTKEKADQLGNFLLNREGE